MSLLPRKLFPNPPARNGCGCSCHNSLAIVKHFRACCPSKAQEERRAELEKLREVINARRHK